MRWYIVALFAISLAVRCSDLDSTHLNPTVATVAMPDPAVQIKVGVPECTTGNWWDEVDDYVVQPVNYEERCVSGAFLTDITPGFDNPRFPDGCRAHDLRVEYSTKGVRIGKLDRPEYSEGGTLYGDEYDAQGRRIMELSVSGGQPTWIKYETWTASTSADAPEELVGNGDRHTVIVDDPEDGVFPSNDRLFSLADILAKTNTPTDNDGFTAAPDYSSCTMRVDIAVADGSVWPPDAAPYLDPTCDNLVVHAKSADGLHTLVGSYGLNYDGIPKYRNWTEEWLSGLNVVKRIHVWVVTADGNPYVEYTDEFAYNADGDLTVYSHTNVHGVEYVETYKYEGSLEGYRYVFIYQSFPDESGQKEPRLYLTREYHNGNLVKVDGYRSSFGDMWDIDPQKPILNGYFSSVPQWRYQVDYDAAGRRIKQEIFWDRNDISKGKPTESRLSEYDAHGHLIHDQYYLGDSYGSSNGGSGLLTEYDFMNNLNRLHGWNHYYEYDNQGRLIRKTFDGPPGVSRFWYDFKYHCD